MKSHSEGYAGRYIWKNTEEFAGSVLRTYPGEASEV
jgi:hypothetical protein